MSQNFSVYFYIYNDTGLTLSFLGDELDSNTHWKVSPPATIPPAEQVPGTATAQARNKRDLEGSDATLAYYLDFENGARSYVVLNGADPFGGANNASVDLAQKTDEQQTPPNYLTPYGNVAVPDIVAPDVVEATLQYYAGTGSPVWSWTLPKKGHPFSTLMTVSLVDEYINWMSTTVTVSNQPLLDQPLINLCLPRSHDSGTYALTNQLAPELYDFQAWLPFVYLPDGGDANFANVPDWLLQALNLIRVHGNLSAAVQALVNEVTYATLLEWGTATTRSVRQQLGDGIRVFDIRVCVTAENEFRIFHTLTGPLIQNVLADMADFAANSTAEFVIVKFSHLSSGHKKGLSKAQHQKLLGMIVTALGANLVPNSLPLSPQTTLRQLVTAAKGTPQTTFLIVYSADSDDKTGPIPPGIWTTDNDIWIDGGKPPNSKDERESYELEQLKNSIGSAKLFNLDFVLTPTDKVVIDDVIARVLGNPSQSLQSWESPLVLDLHRFVQALTPAQQARINSISVDFEEFSEAVPLAIAISRRETIQ